MIRRLMYADPPYLGMCGRYGHDHRDWGCFNDVDTHAALLTHLDTFDGWALCLQSSALRAVLPLAPAGSRCAAWVKPWASFKPGISPAYVWEPVIFRPARTWAQRGGAEQPTVRDWLSDPAARGLGLFGAKPDRFNRWVLDLLGYLPGDEVVDLFPGTGGMGREVAQGRLL